MSSGAPEVATNPDELASLVEQVRRTLWESTDTFTEAHRMALWQSANTVTKSHGLDADGARDAWELLIEIREHSRGEASQEASGARYQLAMMYRQALRGRPEGKRAADMRRATDALLSTNLVHAETADDPDRHARAVDALLEFVLSELRDAERGELLLEQLDTFRRHPALRRGLELTLASRRTQLAKLVGSEEGRIRGALESVDATRRAVGPRHDDYAIQLLHLGELYLELGRPAEARRALETAAQVARHRSRRTLGFVYAQLAECDAAEDRLDTAVEVLDAALTTWKGLHGLPVSRIRRRREQLTDRASGE